MVSTKNDYLMLNVRLGVYIKLNLNIKSKKSFNKKGANFNLFHACVFELK